MCGIAGYLNFNGGFIMDQPELKRFSDCLKLRGPDNENYLVHQYNNAYLGFAHRRLKIIDLSDDANQPMISSSGNTILNYNGEVYNYLELKKELLALGFVFKTKSDTEVILNAYEAFGIEKCLQKLDGMFAFCIFDCKKNTCYLGRDSWGKKPLYYHFKNKTLTYSSDIRSFYVYPQNLTLNNYSLGYYFQELSTPASSTIWQEIQKVQQGQWIEFSDTFFNQKKYSEFDFLRKVNDPIEVILKNCEELLVDSVKKRMLADVPVGTFLSGGVDSGLVTAIAATHSGKKIKTFSVGFDDLEYNELRFAKKIADRYGTDHHEIILTPPDLEIINFLIDEYGEPFADSSMVPTFYVSQLASMEIKVALSGDGGDEVFCGYSIYKHTAWMEKMRFLKNLKFLSHETSSLSNSKAISYLKKLIFDLNHPLFQILYRDMGFSNSQMINLFNNNHEFLHAMDFEHSTTMYNSEYYCKNSFDKICFAILKNRLPNDYLVKVDRASMANSLEVRLPYLDNKLTSYTKSLTRHNLLKNGILKYISKKIAEKYIPKELIYRPKWGFGIPVGKWFRNKLNAQLRETILGGKQDWVPLNYTFIESLIKSHEKGEDHSERLWTLYVFHKWVQITKNNNYSAKFLQNNYKNKKLKVLHIIPSLSKGGAERLAVNISRSLNKSNDFESAILVFNSLNEYTTDAKDLNVFICDAKLKQSILFSDRSKLHSFEKVISEYMPDIIHSHLLEAEFVSRHKIFPRIKYVSHFHNYIPFFEDFNLKTLFSLEKFSNYILKKRLLRKYREAENNFIMISNENFNFFSKSIEMPTNKIVKLSNSIELERFTIRDFKPIGSPLRLISVGSFTPRKAHDFLIYCIQKLVEKKIPVRLEIYGDGILKNKYEELISHLNLENNVFLMGNTDNPEFFLRESDIYIHSSLLEGHPLVIMEAIACGLPSIAINVNGVREVIIDGKNGFLVPERNVDIFCNKIIELVNSPTLYEKMYNFIKINREDFDWNVYMTKLECYYKSLFSTKQI